MGVTMTCADGSVLEEDRVEITFYNKRDGKEEKDTMVLYAPFAWMSTSMKLMREYDDNGKCKNIYGVPYKKVSFAGIDTYWFKDIEGLEPGPRDSLTPEEVDLIKNKFGESPYRHLCYLENEKSVCCSLENACKENDKHCEKTEKIEDVMCRQCLLVLAKRGLARI